MNRSEIERIKAAQQRCILESEKAEWHGDLIMAGIYIDNLKQLDRQLRAVITESIDIVTLERMCEEWELSQK